MGKLLFLLILTCAASISAVGAGSEGLYISLSIVKTEHSRDSNSTRKSIRLDGSNLVYEEIHRRGKPSHREYKLTGPEIERLKKLIRDQGLLVSSSVEIPSEPSPRIDYELTAEIKLDGKESLIEISGPINSDRLKADRTYQRTNKLVDAIEEIIARREETP